jgi:hypothetical protein
VQHIFHSPRQRIIALYLGKIEMAIECLSRGDSPSNPVQSRGSSGIDYLTGGCNTLRGSRIPSME